MVSQKTVHKKIHTPVGLLTLVTDERCLLAVLWEDDLISNRVKIDIGVEDKNQNILLQTEKQLYEYFNKQRQIFDIPIRFIGTDFQKKVWNELSKIPFGETRNYRQIAESINDKNTSRAVGLANGKNPISIIVPCHRVIGTSGKLTGFAGGLEQKEYLLNLEKSIVAPYLF